MKRRWLLEASGVSLLLSLPYFGSLVVPGGIALYHHDLDMGTLVCGILLDLLGFFVLGFVLLALLSRLPRLSHRIAAAILASFVIWRMSIIMFDYFDLWLMSRSNVHLAMRSPSPLESLTEHILKYAHPLGIAAMLSVTVIAFISPSIAYTITRLARLGLAAFAFSLLWIVPELLYFAFGLHETPSFAYTSSQDQSRPNKRIVWIVFDELSYNLVFDHPPNGQLFPNFQSLRSRSISFGNMQPIGSYTDRIIPSLLAGRRIDQIRGTLNGKLLYLDQAQDRWITYDPNVTLFKLAQTNAWNPGAAGSAIPYCRIFKAELTTCSWLGLPVPFEAWAPSEKSAILSDSMAIPRALLASSILKTTDAKASFLDSSIMNYRFMMEESKKLIQNGTLHFVFLHFLVPHPPGIYNRNSHQLSESGNYFDNLALADETFGEVLQQIDNTPWANQTTIIISSDHSWRVPIWRNNSDWTPEEERISQGRFDPRPVFMVHFPDQKSGNEIINPVSELVENSIVASMLLGKIKSPEDLCSAFSALKAPMPSGLREMH